MAEDQVIKQFSKTASAYVNSKSHAAGRDLELLQSRIGNVEGQKALDIATGTGHTAFVLARQGASVTGVDITRRMLEIAEAEAKKQGLNITFTQADAQDLPFADSSFAIVTCRIAPHHFSRPDAFVREAWRILEPEGWLFIIDNVSPARANLAEALNHVEKLRDPSHVRAYAIHEWLEWLIGSGFEIHTIDRWKKRKGFTDWVQRADTPETVADEIRQYLAGASPDVKKYLEIAGSSEEVQNVSHEVGFFQARKCR
jgi:ubiquinone/menaquinone biosynthesis C-methylase UbiE